MRKSLDHNVPLRKEVQSNEDGYETHLCLVEDGIQISYLFRTKSSQIQKNTIFQVFSYLNSSFLSGYHLKVHLRHFKYESQYKQVCVSEQQQDFHLLLRKINCRLIIFYRFFIDFKTCRKKCSILLLTFIQRSNYSNNNQVIIRLRIGLLSLLLNFTNISTFISFFDFISQSQIDFFLYQKKIDKLIGAIAKAAKREAKHDINKVVSWAGNSVERIIEIIKRIQATDDDKCYIKKDEENGSCGKKFESADPMSKRLTRTAMMCNSEGESKLRMANLTFQSFFTFNLVFNDRIIISLRYPRIKALSVNVLYAANAVTWRQNLVIFGLFRLQADTALFYNTGIIDCVQCGPHPDNLESIARQDRIGRLFTKLHFIGFFENSIQKMQNMSQNFTFIQYLIKNHSNILTNEPLKEINLFQLQRYKILNLFISYKQQILIMKR